MKKEDLFEQASIRAEDFEKCIDLMKYIFDALSKKEAIRATFEYGTDGRVKFNTYRIGETVQPDGK